VAETETRVPSAPIRVEGYGCRRGPGGSTGTCTIEGEMWRCRAEVAGVSAMRRPRVRRRRNLISSGSGGRGRVR